MPYVTIRVTGDKVTQPQSEALIAGTTDLITQVLGKDPETTWVLIEELPTEHWGIAGKPATERLAKAKLASGKEG